MTCYIAPDADYFDANSGAGEKYTKHTPAGEPAYYTLNNPPFGYNNFSYCYGSDKRIYAGTDYVHPSDHTKDQLELQYANYNTEEQKKYPLFSLESAQ